MIGIKVFMFIEKFLAIGIQKKIIVFLGVLSLTLVSCKKKDNSVKEDLPCVAGFEKTYGGDDQDLGNSVLALNNTFFLLGTTSSRGNEEGDLFLLRVNNTGEVLWEKTYGGNLAEFGADVIKTADDHLLLTGYSQSFGNGSKDAYLVKVDTLGEVVWEKTYGGDKSDNIERIVESKDGDILLIGTTESFGAGLRDMYFLKLDKNGNVLVEKTYGGEGVDGGSEIALATDGSLMLFGYTESFGTEGSRDYYLVKTNPLGDTIFTKTYGGSGYEESQSIKSTRNNGFIMNGHSSSIDYMHNMYAVKINEAGEIEWEKHYGGLMHDGGHWVIENKDGDFILMGRTNSFGSGDQNIYIVKINPKGMEIATEIVGGNKYDRGNKLIAYNGFYYLIGETDSLEDDDRNMYFVRFSMN